MTTIPVCHLPILLRPDPARTVSRPFLPSDPARYTLAGPPRGARIIARVLSLDAAKLDRDLARVRLSLDARYPDVEATLLRRFDAVANLVSGQAAPSRDQRLLIGAYFSAEYSYESAALFNPSVVAHPDQSGTPTGALRFILSLRGIGEGHLSSVTFRTGIWASDGSVLLNTPTQVSAPPELVRPDGWKDGDPFTLDCSASHDVSQTVLFPMVESQSRGIEDLRMTRVERPDGAHTYAGTYTALGERGVRQEMLETDDFHRFTMRPVTGDLADGKGMALFPRQIGGRHMAIGRQDSENLWLFSSDDPFHWVDGTRILEPAESWEFIQLGNCGSPIEIEEGWLLLTHGVGEVRNYCIGAALLDRDDPSKVLGRLAEPLIEPSVNDRDGYVPNVVYSCGGFVRDRTLLLPYGVADNYTRFATVSVDALISAMT